jgi:hypothetical protein
MELTLDYFREKIKGKRIAIVGALDYRIQKLLQYDVRIAIGFSHLDNLHYFNYRYLRDLPKPYKIKIENVPEIKNYLIINSSDESLFSETIFSNCFRLPMNWTWQGCNPIDPEYEFINILHKKVGNPLTGFIALQHVLQQNPREVYLTGMDLYADFPYKIDPVVGGHNIIKHYDYLKELLRHDSRITLDSRMSKRMGRL